MTEFHFDVASAAAAATYHTTTNDTSADTAAANDTPLADGNLQVALDLAAGGAFVFPCRGRRACSGIGLWRQASTCEPNTLRQWWQSFPDADVAIDLEKTGKEHAISAAGFAVCTGPHAVALPDWLQGRRAPLDTPQAEPEEASIPASSDAVDGQTTNGTASRLWHKVSPESAAEIEARRTPLDIALDYIGRGWNPVPIGYRQKGPTAEGWQRRIIDASNAPRYFAAAKMNVGVILGASSRGLTDVDLDCDEALAIAPYILPKTGAIFGRTSRRAAHRLYYTSLADSAETAVVNFNDPQTKSRMIELRIGGGKGAQTVFPGSTHKETGEPIAWDDPGEPASVDGEDLHGAMFDLAAYTLIARHWPQQRGGRHDCALVLGGFLARSGKSSEQIKLATEAIARAANDEEWKDRRKAAEDAAEAHRSGKHAYGFIALRKQFGDAVAEQVADWLDYDFNGEPTAKGVERIHADVSTHGREGRADAAERGSADSAPLPLFPPLPPSVRFPVECLGRILSNAALAIARKVQVPEALAAQSVLATASLAAQSVRDVMLPYGQTRPLSCYHVTIAPSGDRKSTADDEATWPLRKREKDLREIWQGARERWNVEHAAWSAEKRKIENSKNFDFSSRKAALTALGPAPEPPLEPFLTAPDPTLEGLIKSWVNALPSLGLFSAEGGQFLGGHGMSADHRLKTAAGFSEIWNAVTIKRVRAGDGALILPGRRLAMHMLVQPGAAAAFFSDPILRDQGLLSRVLVAAPDSLAGTRLYKTCNPADDASIRTYGARILELLEAPWPLADGERNVLDPTALTIDGEATAEWCAFHDAVERRCASAGDFASIVDFASKAAEHAARIAGVLSVIADPEAAEIDPGAMANAILIVEWYLGETLRLQRAARTDPKLIRAQRLLEYLQANGSEHAVSDLLRRGPPQERSKAALDETLSVLRAHGWVRETSKRPHRIAVEPAAP